MQEIQAMAESIFFGERGRDEVINQVLKKFKSQIVALSVARAVLYRLKAMEKASSIF